MKKILSILLAAVLIFSCFSINVFAEDVIIGHTDDGLEYAIKNNEVTITDYEGDATELSIPSTIEGVEVKEIGESAFMSNQTLRTVSIPSTVEKIGIQAFSYTSVEKVNFSEGLKIIEDSAFSQCVNLKEVILPDGLERIGYFSFCMCSNLSNIVLPSSLTLCYANSFYETAYFNDKSNWVDNELIIGTVLFVANKQTEGTYTVPQGVTLIADGALWGGKYDKIVISDTVTTINAENFYQNRNLDSVVVPKNITYIAPGNFYEIATGCTIYGYKDSYAEEYVKERNSLPLGAFLNFAIYSEDGYEKGDANMDCKLDILDATHIQRVISKIIYINREAMTIADVNNSEDVDITDVTAIQRKLAGLE